MFYRLLCQYRKLALSFLMLLMLFVLVNHQPKRDTTHRGTPKPAVGLSQSASSVGKRVNTFIIFNNQCTIPYVDPFASDVMDIYKPLKLKECADTPSVFTVAFDRLNKQYVLTVDEIAISKALADVTEYACSYTEIVRGVNASIADLQEPVAFHKRARIPRRCIGILTECREKGHLKRIIQRDAFPLVQHTMRRIFDEEARHKSSASIIILGIHSMSRVNFQRTMPKTAKYLRLNEWYEMFGYHKVADNTLSNLMVLLTGRLPAQFRKLCEDNTRGCIDSITYLWNHFNSAGYITAYADDLSKLGPFIHGNQGFDRQPTDYYLFPFMQVIESLLPSKKHYSNNYCTGRRRNFEYVFDYAEQFIARYMDESQVPVFGMFWTSSLTHDDFAGASALDDKFLGYLQRFEQLQLFKHSIVVLVSDHGMRYGDLTNLQQGFLEERLPLLSIHLPDWYREKYPNKAQALYLNRHRISSTFDLHLTLSHVLHQARPSLTRVTGVDVHSCRSLFRPLAKNRTCSEAGISEHWCSCKHLVKVPIKQYMRHLAKLVVHRMNKMLRKLNYATICHRLSLKSLLWVEREQHYHENGTETDNWHGMEAYRLKFTTLPNDGMYYATIFCDMDISFVNILTSSISRLDVYRDSTGCATNNFAKMLCSCVRLPMRPKNLQISTAAPDDIGSGKLTDYNSNRNYDEILYE